jgi:tRNA A37 threonylcarbamoyladenosine dehydratase
MAAHADHAPELLSMLHQAERLQTLRSSALVYDTIRDQLGELFETRSPARKLSVAEREAEVDRVLAGAADAYGCWAYFPWSNRLVHVLPSAEFAELRASRNKNKITLLEQARLQTTTLGVVGLSVGQATAVTLALEGLGGVLRLADFDTLSLSNLNRLRAGVHELGVNKAVITARAIWEFNPYARIELFEQGIRQDNLERFLEGLDLLLEECDDLETKVRLREAARRRRIPVLMETSDRGLLDVERFDLEPHRPLFHGLTGELRAEQLSGLSTLQKVPVVLSIVGAETISPRLAGSMVDVESTLKTWPQLASAVALGGAINTDTARRILLGQFHGSGRYFVDVESIVADGKSASPLEPRGSAGSTLAPTAAGRPRRAEKRTLGGKPVRLPAEPSAWKSPPTRAQVEQLVQLAALAPSGGNSQPWRFVYQASTGVLACWLVPERASTFLDFERRASHLAFGALAENLRLGCLRLGLSVAIEVLPEQKQPELICLARLDAGPPLERTHDRLLQEQLEQRVTNRQIGTRVALPEATLRELTTSVDGPCRLALLTADSTLSAFGALHGETERLRTLHPQMHRDLMSELRWSPADAERTHDGIELATLELSATDRAGLTVLARADVVEAMRRIDAGQGLTLASRKAMAGASAVGLLHSRGTSPAHYVAAGAAMQRVWLMAQARGFALQPLTAMLYVFARLERPANGLGEREQAGFVAARSALAELFPGTADETPVFAFRLTHAGPPTARALRRPIDELLEIC